jgi:hypothetical protein
MITIEYCKDGEKISDFEYEEWFEKNKEWFEENMDPFNMDVEFKVSTSLIFYYIRVLVAEGKILHNKVQFKMDENIIKIDKAGHMHNNPHDFLSQPFDLSMRILYPTEEV